MRLMLLLLLRNGRRYIWRRNDDARPAVKRGQNVDDTEGRRVASAIQRHATGMH